MTQDDRSITITHRYSQPVAQVFAAWVDPDLLRRWYAPVEGWVVGSAEVIPGVGGSYTVTFGPAPAGDDYRESGTYTVFDPPHRLAWTGTVEGEDMEGAETDELSVEVTFSEVGSATVVTIVERGFSRDEVAEEHTEGWTETLRALGTLFEG